MLHAARCKYRTQKSRQKSTSGLHHTTLSGYIFATKAHIDNRKKLVKQPYVLHMTPQYGELRPTNGWDRSGSLRHPCKFQRVSRLVSVTAYSSGRQPNFAALDRRRHLCSAGWPSRWALAHILVFSNILLLWSPCGIVVHYNNRPLYFQSCRFFSFFFFFFFPRLISAVAEWMSAILAHMALAHILVFRSVL